MDQFHCMRPKSDNKKLEGLPRVELKSQDDYYVVSMNDDYGHDGITADATPTLDFVEYALKRVRDVIEQS